MVNPQTLKMHVGMAYLCLAGLREVVLRNVCIFISFVFRTHCVGR